MELAENLRLAGFKVSLIEYAQYVYGTESNEFVADMPMRKLAEPEN